MNNEVLTVFLRTEFGSRRVGNKPFALAFQIFHGGNSTFTNSFEKTKFLFHSPTDAAPQFLKKLEINF